MQATKRSDVLMDRGDIYIVDLDPTAGHEQRGERPVMVVSPRAFNKVTRLPVVVPITSGGGFARAKGFAAPLSGTKTTGVALCNQPRALDMQARSGRKVESAPQDVVADVMARLEVILG